MGFLSVAQTQMVLACTQWPRDVFAPLAKSDGRWKLTDGMFSIARTLNLSATKAVHTYAYATRSSLLPDPLEKKGQDAQRVGGLSVAQTQMVLACTQWPPDVCCTSCKKCWPLEAYIYIYMPPVRRTTYVAVLNEPKVLSTK